MIDQLRAKAARYCRNRSQMPNFEARLGSGQDGIVWTVADETSAIKVFDREMAFNREYACYRILKEEGINKVRQFNVPEMLDHDDELWVIQMTIVQPPYILDFGKAYVYETRRHTPESLADYDELMTENFTPEQIEEIELALARLKRFGIYYFDVRPGNINCDGLKY